MLEKIVIGCAPVALKWWLDKRSARDPETKPKADAASKAVDRANRRDRVIGYILALIKGAALVIAVSRVQYDIKAHAPLTLWTVVAIAITASWFVVAVDSLADAFLVRRPMDRLLRQIRGYERTAIESLMTIAEAHTQRIERLEAEAEARPHRRKAIKPPAPE